MQRAAAALQRCRQRPRTSLRAALAAVFPATPAKAAALPRSCTATVAGGCVGAGHPHALSSRQPSLPPPPSPLPPPRPCRPALTTVNLAAALTSPLPPLHRCTQPPSPAFAFASASTLVTALRAGPFHATAVAATLAAARPVAVAAAPTAARSPPHSPPIARSRCATHPFIALSRPQPWPATQWPLPSFRLALGAALAATATRLRSECRRHPIQLSRPMPA